MKVMGTYVTEALAHKAMAGMKECQPGQSPRSSYALREYEGRRFADPHFERRRVSERHSGIVAVSIVTEPNKGLSRFAVSNGTETRPPSIHRAVAEDCLCGKRSGVGVCAGTSIVFRRNPAEVSLPRRSRSRPGRPAHRALCEPRCLPSRSGSNGLGRPRASSTP